MKMRSNIEREEKEERIKERKWREENVMDFYPYRLRIKRKKKTLEKRGTMEREKREINNEEERRRKEDDGEEHIPVHAIPAELVLVEFMFSPFIFHWIILIVSTRDDAETEAQHFLQLSFRFYGLCQVLLITSPLNRSLTV